MKKMIMVCCLIYICILAACKNADTVVEGSLMEERNPTGAPLQPSVTMPLENQEPEDLKDYVLSYPISVEDDRALTLNLHGRKLREEVNLYGIGKIEVFDGSNLIQTISIQEAISAEWNEQGVDGDSFGGYTEAFTPDGSLTTVDMNFDSSQDIGLMSWITNNNLPYYYWLWNEEQEQFVYSFCLTGAELDEENHQLLSKSRDGAQYLTEYYQYDESGSLQAVKRVVETYGGSEVITETYELINGEWQEVK
ncbi:hypothetical protein HNQ56_004060 [Anaerotaenia torta]|uniref:XAC2610-related protein n=1 Tax=Anaerotaenia torta TaxID=433293 RepID=UPI003D20AF42